jgi:hypothetical protein
MAVVILLCADSITRTIIFLMMEAARTSETLFDNYITRQYIPEDKSEKHIYVLNVYGHDLYNHGKTFG